MFPIQIRLTVGTQAELDRLTAFVAGNTEASIKAAPKLEAAATEAPGKSKDAPAETSARSKPTAAPAAAPAASTAKQEPQPSTEKGADAVSAPARADVSAAAVKLALKDKPKVIEILAGFGAKGVKDVPDDKLAEVFPLIQAALEA